MAYGTRLCRNNYRADLTLNKAITLAQGMESADRNTRSFKGNEPSIHRLSDRNQPCYRCEKTNHTPSDYRFKDAECHACGKKGLPAGLNPKFNLRANHLTRSLIRNRAQIWFERSEGRQMNWDLRNFICTSSRKHAQTQSRYHSRWKASH